MPDVTRDRLVTVKLADFEYEEVLEAADKVGLPFSTYIRSTVLRLIREGRGEDIGNKGNKIIFRKRSRE